MTEVTLASLAMDFNVAKAEPAKKQTDDLRASARALEEQARATAQAVRDQAVAQGLSGTAAGKAEASVRGLAQVYGNAFNAQSQYNLSQEATAKLILQNARATDALTKEQTRAAKQLEALTRAYDPVGAEIMRTNRLMAEAVKIQGDNGAAVVGLQGKLANLQKAHAASGEAARLQTYQLLNLGRQGADVFVSLASGQALWMVAIQQGAQAGEVFAEAATRGVTFKAALAGIAEAAGPVIALLGPIVLIGGAITAAAVAFNEGDKEAAKLANTLALAGSNAGITAVQFEQFSRQVAGDTKTSVDAARAALLGLTETGKFTGETIKVLGEDVVMFSRLTGKSSTEAVSYFAQMGSGASDFLTKFQESYGGMRLAQIEHIQLLERQGDTTQAQLEAAILVHQRLGKAGPENLGYLEKAWRGVGDAVKDAWTWLKMWGNEAAGRANAIQNIQDQIKLNNERLQGNPATGKGNSFLDDERRQLEARNKGLQAQLAALKAVEAAEQKRVQAEATANQVQADGVAAANEHANSWSKIARNVSLATQEIERYRKGQADIRAANPNSKELDSPAQAAAIEAAIRKRYEHLTKQPAVSAATRADARGDNVVEQAQNAELAAQLALTKNIEQLARIKGAQITQELDTQRVRLDGQVRTKQISQADADAALGSYRVAAGYKRQALDLETANQIAQRDLQQRQEVLGYTQRVAQLQAAAAPTLEKSFAIQSKALAERQAYDRDALEEAVAQRVISGDITLTQGKLLLVDLAIAQAAEGEDKARQDRLAIFQRDLALAQQGFQNEADLLQSRKGLAQSSYEAAQFDRRIAGVRYAAERQVLEKTTIENGYKQDAVDAAQARLPVLEEIYRNELRQLELSDNAVTAYADLVGALSNAARAVIDGDIGGSISAASGVLKQLSGLAGGLGTSLGGALGSAAAVAGPIGAAVSAVTGVLGAIGASSAEKAQRKIEALTKAVEDLRSDNKTSSGSIAAALAEANKNWNSDLEYSSAMLSALRSIDAKTGAAAALLARQVSTGGLLSTSGLGLGSTTAQGNLGAGLVAGGLTGAALAGAGSFLLSGLAGSLALGPIGLVAGAVGALVGALTKTKTTTEILDQGLQFTASTFDQITKNGVTGSSYADLLTTTKKSILGVGYSTKVKTSTVTGSIDPDLLGQISGVIQALGDGVLSAAAVFGVEAAKAAESALGSAVVDLGKLSLKDLKADEIADVLNATFDKVGDQLAAAGVPGLEELATVGEGAFETLTRLAREYQVVDVALASIGKTFGQVGLESIAARDELVQLFGGMDAFTSSTSFFASNFLTDAEQLAPVIKAVNDNLKAYGLTAESSRDQFKDLVLAQDLTTEAGRATYAALLAVAPAFDKVADAAEAVAKTAAEAAKAAEDAAAKAFNDSLSRSMEAAEAEATKAAAAQEAYTNQMTAFANAADTAAHALDGAMSSLTDFADSLKSELGLGTTGGSLAQAERAFKTAVATGNYDAIPELGKAYADAAKSGAGSQSEYLRIIAQIRQASLNSVTSAKSDAYQSSLSALIMGALFQGSNTGDFSGLAQIRALQAAGLPGFATGGSFTIGGNPGVDQNTLSLNGQPIANVSYGETAWIGRGGPSNDNGNAELAAEVRALRIEVSQLRAVAADVANIRSTLTNVTEGGRAMQTEPAA